MESNDPRWRRGLSAVLFMAALAAFATQPMIPFYDAIGFQSAALLFAASVIGLAATWPPKTPTDWLIVAAGIVFLLWGGWALVDETRAAEWRARANDRRCRQIQTDMLSARPRRADGPDLFQALGCRPQADGFVGFPPLAAVGH